MFGMGMTEILVILTVALIVIGPKKLPDLAKSLGRAFNEFRNATTDLKESLTVDPAIKAVKTSNKNQQGATPTPSNKNSAGKKIPAKEDAEPKTRESVTLPRNAQES
jgi:Tat protein translocase TatB subunit